MTKYIVCLSVRIQSLCFRLNVGEFRAQIGKNWQTLVELEASRRIGAQCSLG